jgi:hypothetical protein
MVMKKILFLLLLIIYAVGYSQNTSSISVKGKLIDKSSGSSLEFATVSFISSDLQKLPQGGVTDLEGNYNYSWNLYCKMGVHQL